MVWVVMPMETDVYISFSTRKILTESNRMISEVNSCRISSVGMSVILLMSHAVGVHIIYFRLKGVLDVDSDVQANVVLREIRIANAANPKFTQNREFLALRSYVCVPMHPEIN